MQQAGGGKVADPTVESETDPGGSHGCDTQAEESGNQPHKERSPFEQGGKN